MKTRFPNHPVELDVTKRNSRMGIPLDIQRCALALCAIDTIPGCRKAEIFKTVAYLYFDRHRDKYKVPRAVGDELHVFDRVKQLPPGRYVLMPVPPSGRKKRAVGTQPGRGGGGPRPLTAPNPLVRRRAS